MRRLMLLALLALALPTASLADTIFFHTGDTTDVIFEVSPVLGVFVDIMGPTGKVFIGSTERECKFSGPLFEHFKCTGGFVFADNSLTGATFREQIAHQSGVISRNIEGSGFLEPSARITGGSFSFFCCGPAHASVSATLVPEPSTLLSFGTGLIGLVEMARRRLRLRT